MKSGGEYSLDHSIKRVLVIQGVTTLVVLGIIAIFDAVPTLNLGESAGKSSVSFMVKLGSSCYGSVLAIAGTILSARSVKRASRVADDVTSSSSGAAMVPVYSGLLNKLVIVGGGIAFGLIVLGLEPIHVVTGYLIVQLSTIWTLRSPG